MFPLEFSSAINLCVCSANSFKFLQRNKMNQSQTCGVYLHYFFFFHSCAVYIMNMYMPWVNRYLASQKRKIILSNDSFASVFYIGFDINNFIIFIY